MKQKKIMFILGTRPEAIKLAPLIKEFSKLSNFQVSVCSTGQHKKMLDQVLSVFKINPTHQLKVMNKNQTLAGLTSKLTKKIDALLIYEKPDLIFVQGDTTTAFIGALSAFYHKIKVAHIEAGLRSYNKYSPFPEDINRVLISKLADFHFCPTDVAIKNLQKENIRKNIFKVGNTVIDALLLILKEMDTKTERIISEKFNFLDLSRKVILTTGHRRESFGQPFKEICYALKEIAIEYKDVQFIYPVHLNPQVQKPVYDILKNLKNVFLIEPIAYQELIWLINKSYFVLTDSGGIQEEAPSLGKPVLVMREVTERTEGIKAGNAILVGTSKEKIVASINKLLVDKKQYQRMSKAKNPYGDGKASKRIFNIVKNYFELLKNK
ncbi:MAG: UDP-N-acetylglucosamine 2-epimerase (non-hydrolyzing) [Ignavibacteriales bacterium]|nr:UDP-N-acetylglucosamine 2-epimerase (non-hydrolyzing) [Ignavibacteriales bacterium]